MRDARHPRCARAGHQWPRAVPSFEPGAHAWLWVRSSRSPWPLLDDQGLRKQHYVHSQHAKGCRQKFSEAKVPQFQTRPVICFSAWKSAPMHDARHPHCPRTGHQRPRGIPGCKAGADQTSARFGDRMRACPAWLWLCSLVATWPTMTRSCACGTLCRVGMPRGAGERPARPGWPMKHKPCVWPVICFVPWLGLQGGKAWHSLAAPHVQVYTQWLDTY